MASQTNPPKSGISRRRRFLKWAGRSLMILIVLLLIGLYFLPQIATKLLTKFADELDLDHFESNVVEVTWNNATLTDFSAADADWQATADEILIHYSPWDLLRGQIQQAKLTGLQIELKPTKSDPPPAKPTPTSPPKPDEPQRKSDETTSADFAWLHSLPETLAKCKDILAPNTRIHLTFDQKEIQKTVNLVLHQNSIGAPELILEEISKSDSLTLTLNQTSPGSTVVINFATHDPEQWINATELLLEIKEPWLPSQLTLGPTRGDVLLTIDDTVKSAELSGSMTNLTYTLDDASLSARSSLTKFEGNIQPDQESQILLTGDLATCDLTLDALPGETLQLPTNTRPTWSTTLAWGEKPFSFAGALNNLALRGTDPSQPLRVEGPDLQFSNQDALFRTNGTLKLNTLDHPFEFILQPATSSTNAQINIGPVTLSGSHPLFPASSDFAETSGTFQVTAALLLAPSTEIAGTITLQASDTVLQLPDHLATIGPLEGTAKLILPPDNTSRNYSFDGRLKGLAVDTSETLGFPISLLKDSSASIDVIGQLTNNQRTFDVVISDLDLEGQHNAETVTLSILDLKLDSRGDKLRAKALALFGETGMHFDYSAEREDLPNDEWHMVGQLSLAPTNFTHPLPNLGAFSERLDGLAISGSIESRFEFETNSRDDFKGSLQFGISDGTIELQDTLSLNTLKATAILDITPDQPIPLSWKTEGSFEGLTIHPSTGLGFPLIYDGSLDDIPASFAISGTTGQQSKTEGSIPNITLTGDQHGETITFENTSLKFLLSDQSLTAEGNTSLDGNKLPFLYEHTAKTLPDNTEITTGTVQIPVTNLSSPITTLGTLSETVAGMRLSGKLGATLKFESDPTFSASLDASLQDGELSLPNDGPALSGIDLHFHTPDLNTLHTTKAESFSMDSLSYGDLAFTKLSGSYQIQPNGDLSVPRFQSNFLGGRIKTDPFTYPADDKDFRLDLRFANINLRTLTSLFPAFDGFLDGTIDGHLPVARKKGNYFPERGGIKLSPKSSARLRYNADSLFTGGLSPKSAEYKRMKIAEDSLKDLRIPILSGRLFDPKDKGKAAVIRIEGKSSTIEDAPPIHLNFNLFEPDGEFRQLLDYFFMNRDKLDFGL